MSKERLLKALYVAGVFVIFSGVAYVSYDASTKYEKTNAAAALANAALVEAKTLVEKTKKAASKEELETEAASTVVIAQNICDEKFVLLSVFLDPPIVLNSNMLVGQAPDGRLYGVADTNKAMPIGWICSHSKFE